MAMAQITVVPLGTGTTSLSPFVAGIVRWLEERNAQFRLTPMATVLNGDVSEIFSSVSQIQELPFKAGATRVMTLVNIDDRRDKKTSAKGKVDSVKARLKQVFIENSFEYILKVSR